MREFVNMPYDNDILEKVIIKKDNRKISYMSHRNISTDFPVLTCAVSKLGDKFAVAVGARPQKAVLVLDEENILSCDPTKDEIEPDILLLEYVRSKGCYSVKRGCETANCGLCTVWVENKPVLSCSTLAAQVNNKHVITLEGVQERAIDFGTFLAKEGAEQCGYCSPGFIMNVLAMEDVQDIKVN